jgi:tetratricopeptide (TPR) repeat protein
MSSQDDRKEARRAKRRYGLAIAALLSLPAVLTLLAFGALVTTPLDALAIGTPLVVTPTATAPATLIPAANPDALVQAGLAAYEAGDFALAEQQFRSASRLAPDEAVLHNALGMALAQQNRTGEAIAAYQASIVLDPGLADAVYNLASAEHALGRLDEAEAAYRRAIALDPQLLAAYRSLGALYAGRNEIDQAALTLEQAAALAPTDAWVRYDLGLIYLLQGKPDAARQQLQQAEALAVDAGLADKVRRQLASLDQQSAP